MYLFELFNELENHQILTKYLNTNEFGLKCLNLNNNDYYFGFTKKGEPEGLGLVYDQFRVKKVGVFKQGLLNGLGKINEDDYFLDGEWRNGEFIKGFFFHEKTQKYHFGSFFKNKCCNIEMDGQGFPIDLISNKCFEYILFIGVS